MPKTPIVISGGSLSSLSSSSSSVVDAVYIAAGTSYSLSRETVATKDDETWHLDHDGDDEDEDYYSADQWNELLMTP